MVDDIDLLHQELLELGQLWKGGVEVVSPGDVLEQSLVYLGVIFLSDSLQLVVHLLLKIISIR